jgi:hypothetical protein
MTADHENPTHTTRGTTMTDTTKHDTTEAPEAPENLDDLTESDCATAGAQLSQEAADAQGGTTEPDDADEPDDGSPRDQRYRARARAAEAERDKVAAVVDGMRRAEVERLVAPKLADPGDLFRDGVALADLLDDQGRVDPAVLDKVVDKVIGDHPHWRARVSSHYGGTLHSGATQTRMTDAPRRGFSDAFSPQPD